MPFRTWHEGSKRSKEQKRPRLVRRAHWLLYGIIEVGPACYLFYLLSFLCLILGSGHTYLSRTFPWPYLSQAVPFPDRGQLLFLSFLYHYSVVDSEGRRVPDLLDAVL